MYNSSTNKGNGTPYAMGPLRQNKVKALHGYHF
jgi:hypothetical protein